MYKALTCLSPQNMNNMADNDNEVPDEQEAVSYLKTMETFCRHLIEFIGRDATSSSRLEDYVGTERAEDDPELIAATRKLQAAPYMAGIPKIQSKAIQRQVGIVQRLGTEA